MLANLQSRRAAGHESAAHRSFLIGELARFNMFDVRWACLNCVKHVG